MICIKKFILFVWKSGHWSFFEIEASTKDSLKIRSYNLFEMGKKEVFQCVVGA
jgi:hypothetical protein